MLRLRDLLGLVILTIAILPPRVAKAQPLAVDSEPAGNHIGIYLDSGAQTCQATLDGPGQIVQLHVLAVLPDFAGTGISACEFRIAGLPASGPPGGIWWTEWTANLVLGDLETGIVMAWSDPPTGQVIEIGTITFYSLEGEGWIGPNQVLDVDPWLSHPNQTVVDAQTDEEMSVGGGHFTFNCSDPPNYPCYDASEPVCQLEPTFLHFSGVHVGESRERTCSIRNLAGGVLTGFVSGGCSGFEIVAGAGAFSLAGGEGHAVTVRFTPPVSGDQYCDLDLGTDQCSQLRCVGYGLVDEGEAVCEITPDSLDFGELVVGGTSDLSFTISNLGDATLIGRVAEDCSDVAILSGGGNYWVPPGDSHDVVVRFAPTQPGQQVCKIALGTARCDSVTCRGSAQATAFGCLLSANALDFGDIAFWETATRSFSITNVGESPLNGTLATDGEAFHLNSGEGPFVLQPSETLTAEASFQPGVPGSYDGLITTGLADCPQIVLSGTATHGGDEPFLGIFSDDQAIHCEMSQQPYETATVHVTALLPMWLPSIIAAEFRLANLPPAGSGGLINYNWNAEGVSGDPDVGLMLVFDPPLQGPLADLGTVEFYELDPEWLGVNHELAIAPNLNNGMLLVAGESGDEYACQSGHFTFNCTGGCGCFYAVPVALSDFSLADLGGAARATWRYEGGGDAEFRLEGERDGFSWEVAWQQTAPGQYEAEDHAAALAMPGSLRYRLYGRLPGESWQLLRDETLAVSGRHFRTALGAAHPNPFNPQVTLPFSLAAAGRARLAVYDVAGRLVRELLNEQRPAGEHSLVWDGRDADGRSVGTGVYFVRLEAAGTSESQKLVLLR